MGVHDAPLAREEVQSLRLPLAMAPDASHVAVHTAVSVSVPALQDLVPDRM